MEPLVSVIIPVYNAAPYLRRCLDSVCAQTLRRLEVICIDDGSTDGSSGILDEYCRQDSRLCVIHQKNSGPGPARNCGLDRATGSYIIFLDADDWFEPDFLEAMSSSAEAGHLDVTICRADEFDTHQGKRYPADWMLKKCLLPSDTFSPQDIAPWVFQFTYGMAWDKLYRASYIKETGIQFPDLRNSEDLVFVFPSVLLAGRIGIVDRVLIHHRVNRADSVSNSRCAAPDAPYKAFSMVKRFLEQHRLYDRFEQSFLNWAMEFLVWHVSNIPDCHIQRSYLDRLKNEWFPELRFDRYPRSYYRDRLTYAKYQLAKYAPWPVFSRVVKGYHRFRRRKTGDE